MTFSEPTLASKYVDETILGRRSLRAFLPTALPDALVRDIIQVAGRAPSGTNTQPWHVYATSGAKRQAICDEVLATLANPSANAIQKAEYDYYPAQWISPFVDRRRKVGFDLYALLGLTRDNKAGMAAQGARNFVFFDAPVGLFFTVDRIMGKGSWLDYGMFLQNIMLAARARGLDTCPQAAWCEYHAIITQHLNIPESQMLVCGMALGYADMDHVVNSFTTEREPVDSVLSFHK